MPAVGIQHTPEAIEKMRQAHKGMNVGARNPFYGKHHSDEAKAKMRVAKMGNQQRLGTCHTSKSIKKMSEAKVGNQHTLGHHLTAEHKARIGKSKRGIRAASETRRKMSKSHKGKKNHFYGKKHSEDTLIKLRAVEFTEERRAKMSVARKLRVTKTETREKMSRNLKKFWQDPEYRDRTVKAALLGLRIHPNKPEKVLLALLDEISPNEWEFVGDGQLVIGGKNPDFANTNGKKQLGELWGDYWHFGENPQDRIDLFKEYGYHTLIIWEHELKTPKIVLSKIRKFTSNS